MTLLRWLRETSRRQVPQWMVYGGVVGIFAIFVFIRVAFALGGLETTVLAAVVGVCLASVAKIIWAAANPLSQSDDSDDPDDD